VVKNQLFQLLEGRFGLFARPLVAVEIDFAACIAVFFEF